MNTKLIVELHSGPNASTLQCSVFIKGDLYICSPVKLHSRPNASTLQPSVFIKGDLYKVQPNCIHDPAFQYSNLVCLSGVIYTELSQIAFTTQRFNTPV